MVTSSLPLPERRSRFAATSLPMVRGASTLMPLMPAILMLYATLIPQEVRIELAGQVIYPYRAVTFACLPWIITNIAKGRYPFRLADLWVFVGVVWMIVSFSEFYGIADGLRRGGALALDVIAPYLIIRLTVRSFDDIRRLLVVLAPGLMIAGVSMMIESITHRQIVRPAFAAIFGNLTYFENGQAVASAKEFEVVRLGLLRAPGPFAHPILAGLFMASFLPLYINSSLRKWPYKIGIIASLLAFFSVSSAAMLSMMISFALLTYDWFQRKVSGIGWRFFLFSLFMFLTLLQIGSKSGVVPILIRYTLDPQTGQFRQLIWEYGSRSVAKHPWFGIGFTDYERLPWMINSIDNHWLLLGVRHGYITPVCLFMACATGIFFSGRSGAINSERDRKLSLALSISLAGLVINGFTTSYFGGTLTWFMGLIAITLAITEVGPKHRRDML